MFSSVLTVSSVGRQGHGDGVAYIVECEGICVQLILQEKSWDIGIFPMADILRCATPQQAEDKYAESRARMTMHNEPYAIGELARQRRENSTPCKGWRGLC